MTNKKTLKELEKENLEYNKSLRKLEKLLKIKKDILNQEKNNLTNEKLRDKLNKLLESIYSTTDQLVEINEENKFCCDDLINYLEHEKKELKNKLYDYSLNEKDFYHVNEEYKNLKNNFDEIFNNYEKNLNDYDLFNNYQENLKYEKLCNKLANKLLSFSEKYKSLSVKNYYINKSMKLSRHQLQNIKGFYFQQLEDIYEDIKLRKSFDCYSDKYLSQIWSLFIQKSYKSNICIEIYLKDLKQNIKLTNILSDIKTYITLYIDRSIILNNNIKEIEKEKSKTFYMIYDNYKIVGSLILSYSIFLGFLYNYILYNKYFEFDIFNFVDPLDLIMSWISNDIFIVFILGIFCMTIIIYFVKDKQNFEINYENNINKRLLKNKHFYFSIGFFILYILSIFLLYYLMVIEKKYSYSFFCFLAHFIFGLYSVEFLPLKVNKTFSYIKYIFLVSVSTLIVIGLSPIVYALKLINEHNLNKVKLKLVRNIDSFNSKDNFQYISSTSSVSVFLVKNFDHNYTRLQVFNNSDISSMYFYNNLVNEDLTINKQSISLKKDKSEIFLFTSGSIENDKHIKKVSTLTKSFNYNKKYFIKIVGYSDIDNIEKSKNKINDNYSLSIARAENIKKHFVNELLSKELDLDNFRFETFGISNEQSTGNLANDRKVIVEVFEYSLKNN
ncbi:hypothetical protein ACH5BF_02180 [Arcobacter sp. YIC-464]|uniref:hypothetical protein n=1 Tax=Arcobacter sp. YIC-464 TaxID=3376631 RepID=UPI003C1B85D3